MLYINISQNKTMLKQVPLEAINVDLDKDSSIKITKTRGIKDELNHALLESIIIENINIQFALMQFYHYRKSTIYKDLIHNIGFTNNNSHSSQIEYFNSIFSNVLLLSSNGTPISCNVSRPFDRAMLVFDDIVKQKKINKWIDYFMSRPAVNDCNQMVCYQYFSQEEDERLYNYSDELTTDVFFNYLLYNDRNKIDQKGFPIVGFTLNEIDMDPIIKALSKIVKHLYIFISEDSWDDISKFNKFVTWVD